MANAYQDVVAMIKRRADSIPVKQIDIGIAILVTVAGAVMFAAMETNSKIDVGLSFVRNIEQRSLDERFRLRGLRAVDPRIVIVGIDEKTLQKVGSWPISRSAYARLIDQLAAGGAKVAAFDVTFPTPEKNSAVEALKKLESDVGSSASPQVRKRIREIESTSDNDVILAESMKKANNVILGHIFLDKARSQDQDPKMVEDFYSTLSLHAFPSVIKVKSGDRDFDMNKAWADDSHGHDGSVWDGFESNIRILAEGAKSYGFFNDIPDADGTFRRALLMSRYKDQDYFPSLALMAVQNFEDIDDTNLVAYMSEDGLERIKLGSHDIPTAHDGTALINYAGPYRSYRQYSMADVMDGTVPAATFKNKIVLVGAAAVGIGDTRITPFQSSDYMGVEIHANTMDNLLHSQEPGRGFLHRGHNEEMIDLLSILILGLGMGFWFGRTKPLYATLGLLAALAGLGGAEFLAFKYWGMWLSFVIPAATLLVGYAAITSFRMAFEEREKRKIRKSFSTYVSPGVIKLIEENPKKYFFPGGEEKVLTVMFSDIRGFTSISEGLTPNELVALLNEYLGAMTDILFLNFGTLDKYIGDAIMGFWGSPLPQDDHAVRACHCALGMSAKLDELNLKWEKEGRKQLNIGIGLNSGAVNVGNMGSNKRLAWTVMGDNVNLASRLEGQTKDYHCRILISENTYQFIKDQFVCRDLDRLVVKGKKLPVNVYELLAHNKDAAAYADLVARFDEAQAAYRRQDWAGAIQKFEELLTRYPDDGPSHTILKRCHDYLVEAPSPDWDGVFVATSK